MSTTNIIVLVPGTTASNLVNKDGLVIWPDEVFLAEDKDKDDPTSLLFKATMADMKSDNLRPDTVLVQVDDKPTAYQGFLDYFANGQNFPDPTDAYAAYFPIYGDETDGIPAISGFNDSNQKRVTSLSSNSLIAFAYDWRQDNITNAKSLQALLQLVKDMVDGDLSIHLVGHSMGGLVSRAYLEVVGKNDPWYDSIQNLVTIATPHRGAPLALSAITGQLPELQNILITNFAEEFVDLSEFPSGYQLLPSHKEDSFVDCSGTDYSIYANSPSGLLDILLNADYQNANQVTPDGANADNFNANTNFFDQLDPTALKDRYRCIFASNSGATVTGFTYTNPIGSTATGVQKGGVLSPETTAAGGDQVVPLDSAQFSGVVATANTYQAQATDPDANSNQPWTEGEPTHINLVGRTDVLTQIKNWIQG